MSALSYMVKTKAMFNPEEIYKISQEISSKYAPVVVAKPSRLVMDIALSPKELFEISEEITRKYTPKLTADTPKLVLLPIDPVHLFASWNLGGPGLTPAKEGEPQEQNFVLRIYPENEVNVKEAKNKDWFDVAINAGQTRKKVPVPKEHKANAYTAAIGKLGKGEHFSTLATSKAAKIPNMPSKGKGDWHINNPNQTFLADEEKLPDSRYNVSSLGIN